MKYAAVITAAGLSSRMGQFKPALPLTDRSIIQSTIRNLKAADVHEIVVVTGHRTQDLCAQITNCGVSLVKNEAYAHSGMFDSVCIGLKTLPSNIDRVLVTPADIPMVKPETLRELLHSSAELARPTHSGQNGHPLMLSTALLPDICAYQGDGGLKGAAAALNKHFAAVPVDDVGILLDADTPEDYLRLLYLDAGRRCLPAAHAVEQFRSVFPDAEIPEGLPDVYCEGLLDGYSVPNHIKRHCRAVADQAELLAAQLTDPHIDRGRLRAAALLHDIARLEPDHPKAGARILTALGYSDLAAIVAVHHDLWVSETDPVSEAVILYYADKLIQEDRKVTLQQRFDTSRAKCTTPEAVECHRIRLEQALAAQRCVLRAIHQSTSSKEPTL